MNQPPLGTARMRTSAGHRILGVLGEVLVTLGLIVALYVAWELWWTNIDSAQAQSRATSELVQSFGDIEVQPQPGQPEHGPAPITQTRDGETFGIMYFPQFGSDGSYSPVTGGVGPQVIDRVGIGHYPHTQDPGEPGNFAVAAHRQSHGEVFRDIDRLGQGDRVYLQTSHGYYTYTWRRTEVVAPDAAQVLLPVPHHPGAEPGGSILTMTSCHPPFSTRERIITYSDLTDWRPLESGPPEEIRTLVQQATG